MDLNNVLRWAILQLARYIIASIHLLKCIMIRLVLALILFPD